MCPLVTHIHPYLTKLFYYVVLQYRKLKWIRFIVVCAPLSHIYLFLSV